MINILTKNQKGFTLIELAIVMMIAGVLLTLLGGAITSFFKQTRISQTETRIATIETAIDNFLSLNNRLPCPASPTAAPGAAAFNVEVTTTNCNSAATISGAVSVPGRSASRVRIGTVPVRSLNLPDETALDGWGNRFTYAVTQVLATNGLYDNTLGSIAITDSVNSLAQQVINPPNTAHYVLLSHGPTAMGARSQSGVLVEACGGTSLDETNCDGTSIFTRTILNSDTQGTNFYDDILVFKARERNNDDFPSGGVVAFNDNVCPVGWSLAPALEGRFIIGRTASGAGVTQEQYNVTTGSSANRLYNLGDTGQTPAEVVPPYIALTYCEKD
jgi:prepilin-type N-terminal cleavage/methylation domain-containing protein